MTMKKNTCKVSKKICDDKAPTVYIGMTVALKNDIFYKFTKINVSLKSKPNAQPHIMNKTPANLQNNR